MEILFTVMGLAVVLGFLWLFSYVAVKVWVPRLKRPRIIRAIETTERIGLSDIDSNIKKTAERWNLLRTGLSDVQIYRLESYRERMKAALCLLDTREDDLKKHSAKGQHSWMDALSHFN